ncbi:MAG: beta-phosphoglucomutase family hydrolase [Acidimicrobiia bacterium]|nr:beta-phosphoglucomutase family hydrolase [Acidimicrobiia bacterium]
MQERPFDAVIFDLDGVITATASVHSSAWKQMFDEYLRRREAEYGEPFREFTHAHDYLPYVDGKPRYKGVESFLESRGMEIPIGHPEDEPNVDTVYGLGNRKNELFNEIIRQGGAEVFETSVNLIEDLRRRGIGIGVASSSKNCRTVLESTGLLELFDTRVDGVVSVELGLRGKPEADIFTVASDNLGVPYDRAIVVEDAVSGVQAGAAGNFGLVLGIAREDNAAALRANGADLVVEDLGDIDYDGLANWFTEGLESENWSLSDTEYLPKLESTREALLTVGNGYFGTRGAQEECEAGHRNYPGTYIAGVYNRLWSQIGGREVDNEDLVNCTNWLPMTFSIDGGDWFDPNAWEILAFSRRLDFRSGVLHRTVRVSDEQGRETLVESWRCASMADPHLAALRYVVTPLNYSGKISIRSGLDGRVVNGNVERYAALANQHLEPIGVVSKEDVTSVTVRTSESAIEVATAARLSAQLGGTDLEPVVRVEAQDAAVYSLFGVQVGEGEGLAVDKVVGIFTSNDHDHSDPLASARRAVSTVSYADIVAASEAAWRRIWEQIDIEIEGDRLGQKILRLHLYHCMATASRHTAALDVGIPARGLHGEAYRGHIFWDEIFILPLYNLHYPEVTKGSLLYRYRRLDQARDYANEHGYEGAMYPWQSGSDGREETPTVHLNPISGMWGDDYSSLQRHVSLAVAHGVWEYYRATEDVEFLQEYGAETLVELARFWAGIATLNPDTGRYEIAGVMGPDEFHEKYPGATTGGLKDNSYTNIMVAWLLRTAAQALLLVGPEARQRIAEKTGLEDDESDGWDDISARLNLLFSEDGILEQFDGYFELDDLDWDEYRARYGSIGRMDRLLKAEGKSPDDYKVAKQADALMPFYILPDRVLRRILSWLGHKPGPDLLRKNFAYYLERTSHGSTLSRLVHAQLANEAGFPEVSWDLYRQALLSDIADTQGGTTKEGIHTGVMAGTVLLALHAYAGLDFVESTVHLTPRLPKEWRGMRFSIGRRGHCYNFVIDREKVDVRVNGSVEVSVAGTTKTVPAGQWTTFEIE